jgi:hypothetical protein
MMPDTTAVWRKFENTKVPAAVRLWDCAGSMVYVSAHAMSYGCIGNTKRDYPYT